MPAPRDTSPEMWQRYLAGHRALTPAARLGRALEMSDTIGRIARDGIRSQHPEWSDDQVQEELERRMLGRTLARTVREARFMPTR